MLSVSDVRFSNQSGSSAGEKESAIRKAASANRTPNRLWKSFKFLEPVETQISQRNKIITLGISLSMMIEKSLLFTFSALANAAASSNSPSVGGHTAGTLGAMMHDCVQ